MMKEKIKSSKPSDLGPIEPQLDPDFETDITFLDRQGKSLSKAIETQVCEWLPVRGWIVQLVSSNDPHGHSFDIHYAYEIDGRTVLGNSFVGYDGHHWGVAAPEHLAWFKKTIKEGNAATILVDPEKHDESVIFGQLEAFDFSSGKGLWIAN